MRAGGNAGHEGNPKRARRMNAVVRHKKSAVSKVTSERAHLRRCRSLHLRRSRQPTHEVAESNPACNDASGAHCDVLDLGYSRHSGGRDDALAANSHRTNRFVDAANHLQCVPWRPLTSVVGLVRFVTIDSMRSMNDYSPPPSTLINQKAVVSLMLAERDPVTSDVGRTRE